MRSTTSAGIRRRRPLGTGKRGQPGLCRVLNSAMREWSYGQGRNVSLLVCPAHLASWAALCRATTRVRASTAAARLAASAVRSKPLNAKATCRPRTPSLTK